MKYVLILQVHGITLYEEFDDLEALKKTLEIWLEHQRYSYPLFNFEPIIYRAERVGGA